MLRIPDYTSVRIVKLRPDIDHRSTISSFPDQPQPIVGDVATIVNRAPDGVLYIVEKVREDGFTDWLSTFAEDELEVVE